MGGGEGPPEPPAVTTGGDIAGVVPLEKTALCFMGSPGARRVGGGGGGILVPIAELLFMGDRLDAARLCGGVARAAVAVAVPLAYPLTMPPLTLDGCLVGGGGALLAAGTETVSSSGSGSA